jgi:hypothetical protein
MAKETLNHAEIFCLLASPKLKLNVAKKEQKFNAYNF